MRGLLVWLVVCLGVPAHAQEVGGRLGSPTPEQTDWQTELEAQTGEPGTEPATEGPAAAAAAATGTAPGTGSGSGSGSGTAPAGQAQGEVAVPPGYQQNPTARNPATPTRFHVRPAAPRRVRVRVRDGTEVPHDARIYERRSKFLLIPGVIAFVVSYSIALTGAIVDDDGLLYAPFIGPVLWQLDEGNSDTAGLMVLLTLAQTAGAFLFGFGMRKKTYAEWHTSGDRRIALGAVPTRRGAALNLRVW